MYLPGARASNSSRAICRRLRGRGRAASSLWKRPEQAHDRDRGLDRAASPGTQHLDRDQGRLFGADRAIFRMGDRRKLFQFADPPRFRHRGRGSGDRVRGYRFRRAAHFFA